MRVQNRLVGLIRRLFFGGTKVYILMLAKWQFRPKKKKICLVWKAAGLIPFEPQACSGQRCTRIGACPSKALTSDSLEPSAFIMAITSSNTPPFFFRSFYPYYCLPCGITCIFSFFPSKNFTKTPEAAISKSFLLSKPR